MTDPRRTYRDQLRAVREGDTVNTAVPDPWGAPSTDPRPETVTSAGRYLIRTTHALYTRRGRCLTPTQPLAYPRWIISTTPQETRP